MNFPHKMCLILESKYLYWFLYELNSAEKIMRIMFIVKVYRIFSPHFISMYSVLWKPMDNYVRRTCPQSQLYFVDQWDSLTHLITVPHSWGQVPIYWSMVKGVPTSHPLSTVITRFGQNEKSKMLFFEVRWKICIVCTSLKIIWYNCHHNGCCLAYIGNTNNLDM